MRTKLLTAVDLKCMFNSRNQDAKHAKMHEGNTNEPFYYGSTLSISTYCIYCTLTRLIGLRRDGICKHCGALNTLQVVFMFTVCSGHVPSLFFHMVESFCFQKFWKPMENVPSHRVVRLRTNSPPEVTGN